MGPDEIVAAISHLSGPDLERVRKAVERRRAQLIKQSSVVERRNHGRGILQLEFRANPKTGTKRGPYWYFFTGERKATSTACTWVRPKILIYSQPGRQKLRNFSRNPRVGLNLNSNAHGGDIVRVEGMAEIVEDAPPATEVPEYVEKYRAAIARIGLDPESFAQAYSVAIRMTPSRWHVW